MITTTTTTTTSARPARARPGHPRTGSSAGSNTELWPTLLDSVSATKQFPTKSVLVLGGAPTSQRAFISALVTTGRGMSTGPNGSNGGGAVNNNNITTTTTAAGQPIANELAVGYTYVDVIDSEQDDDVVARLSIHTLAEPDPALVDLLRPVLTTKVLSGMMVVILIDWHRPWTWIRQLRGWIRQLRRLVSGLDPDAQAVLEDNVVRWQTQRRDAESSVGVGFGIDGSPPTSTTDTTTAPLPPDAPTVPLGPGEWDAPIGLPVCVVAQHAERIEHFERSRGWHNDEFDYILQTLRTILLKHGAGVVYTTNLDVGNEGVVPMSVPVPVRDLVHAMLDIRRVVDAGGVGGTGGSVGSGSSGTGTGTGLIRHNVIDRDQVMVPPNWDSWGKIRVLREGFDVERVSRQWDADIDIDADDDDENDADTVVAMYESVITPPVSTTTTASTSRNQPDLDVHPTNNQVFLETQLKVLQQLHAEDESDRRAGKTAGSGSSTGRASLPAGFGASTSSTAVAAAAAAAAAAAGGSNQPASTSADGAGGIVDDQIGPVQFNLGGIQVNADEVLRKIQEREVSRTTEENASTATPPVGALGSNAASVAGSTIGDKTNAELATFFASLSRKTGGAGG